MPLPKIRVRIWHLAALVALAALGIEAARLARLSRDYAQKAAKYAAMEQAVLNSIQAEEARELANLDADRRMLGASRRETVAEWSARNHGWVMQSLATPPSNERRRLDEAEAPLLPLIGGPALARTPEEQAEHRHSVDGQILATAAAIKTREEDIQAALIETQESSMDERNQNIHALLSVARERPRKLKEKYRYYSLRPWEAVPPDPP